MPLYRGGNALNTFDFWTLHFNEELSAFSGDLLEDQAEYLNDCIRYVLSLYAENHALYRSGVSASEFPPMGVQPSNVILVGHSMGGVVSLYVVLHVCVLGQC